MKITKEQKQMWIVANCMNEKGIIDLEGLTFNCDVNISNMKVDGNLYQDCQTVTNGDLCQSDQEVNNGYLWQRRQEVKNGYLFQDYICKGEK